jgi:hypothetical protein
LTCQNHRNNMSGLLGKPSHSEIDDDCIALNETLNHRDCWEFTAISAPSTGFFYSCDPVNH